MGIKKTGARRWLTIVPGALAISALMGLLVLTIIPNSKIKAVPLQTIQPAKVIKQAQTYRGLPVRLKIPAINVDTAIEYMGDTKSGDMAVPSNLVDVSWYKYGPLPGETGSSVIAGHVVGYKNEPGVFNQLDKLKTGDLISVIDAKGQAASFVVRESKIYDPLQQHDEVFNSVKGTHLNLITCAGDWDASHLHYLKRLVVFADIAP